MSSFILTLIISGVVAVLFSYFQFSSFFKTKKSRKRCEKFFPTNFGIPMEVENSETGDSYKLLPEIEGYKDYNELISKINSYIAKTKGTVDFTIIQNKTERIFGVLYDESVSKLSFPTYYGLMGTFAGVFIGILMFLLGLYSTEGISDESIQNLLVGVLVSMSTSFVGLLLTTKNNKNASKEDKKVEEGKNNFYDFIQTEIIKNFEVSLMKSVTKLHETVDTFEPSFTKIIDQFNGTFKKLVDAFGKDFGANVNVVANAVKAMGENMGMINENIALQKQLISTMQSDKLVEGMEKYIEASDHFVGITQSLNKFEQARRMMLAAAQETIKMQEDYTHSLEIPKEVAVKVNQILNRIKDFEENINRLGGELNRREILGNDVVNKIQDQINGILKKSKIADSFLDKADDELENLYREQVKVIGEMNKKYRDALDEHMEGYEKMLDYYKEVVSNRLKLFMEKMDEKISLDEVHQDFSNLKKLNDISSRLNDLDSHLNSLILKINDIKSESVKSKSLSEDLGLLYAELGSLKDRVNNVKGSLDKLDENTKRISALLKERENTGLFGNLFGGRKQQ